MFNRKTSKWFVSDVPRGEFVTITPDMAREALAHNVNNRRLRDKGERSHVANLARMYRAGQWQEGFMGSPLAFTPTGEVNNGQHRLHAIIAADMPVTLWCLFGEPVEHKRFYDIGAMRTAADISRFSNPDLKYLNNVQSLIRIIEGFNLGRFTTTAHRSLNGMTAIEVDDYTRQYGEELSAICARAVSIKNAGLPARANALAFVLWILDNYGYAGVDHDDFFRSTAEGVGFTHGDPRLALATTLRNWTTDENEGAHVFALLRAFNAHVAGESIGKGGIRLRHAGNAARIPFPAAAIKAAEKVKRVRDIGILALAA